VSVLRLVYSVSVSCRAFCTVFHTVLCTIVQARLGSPRRAEKAVNYTFVLITPSLIAPS
jgi:hypothetical protein